MLGIGVTMATAHERGQDTPLEGPLATARRLLADDKGSDAMESVWAAESESAGAGQAKVIVDPPDRQRR
jgi:hypothetical protein